MKVLRYKSFEKNAEISVFISLLCVSVCAFIYVLIKSAGTHATKLQVEALTDIAVRSAFSEYCKPLYEKYGLLYVDTAYKSDAGGKDILSTHVASYFDINTDLSGMFYGAFFLKDIIISNEVYANENDYESLKRQICFLMRQYDDSLNDYECLVEYAKDNFREQYKEEADEDMRLHKEIFGEDIFYTEDDIINNKSQDELFNDIRRFIYDDMKVVYSDTFSYKNLIEKADMTFVIEENEKEYEITKDYSLFVQ